MIRQSQGKDQVMKVLSTEAPELQYTVNCQLESGMTPRKCDFEGGNLNDFYNSKKKYNLVEPCNTRRNTFEVVWSGNYLVSFTARRVIQPEGEDFYNWPTKLNRSHPKELIVPVEREFIEDRIPEEIIKKAKEDYFETKR